MPRYIDVVEVIYEGDNMKALPAADIEEVRHGEWVFNRDGYICCSKCGCQPYRESRTIDFDNLWERCPNCGAKMDRKESNE